MSKLNVLVLSVGRRVELIQFLRKSLVDRGLSFKLFGADASKLAPALYECDDHVILPKITDGHYLKTLRKTIEYLNIQIIIPTIDTELSVLAQNKDSIEFSSNTKVIVSELKAIEIFQDKLKSATFMEENQILTPKVLDYAQRNRFDYPVFIKPSKGSSSINALKIYSLEELERWFNAIERPIIQSFISGKEYTVDAYIDSHNALISESHRLRIKTRSGEILIGQMVFIDDIRKIILDLLTKIKLIGPITFQFIEENRQYYLIEVNPRLGGGVPMSLRSGIDITGNLIDEYLNQPLIKTSSKGIEKIYSRFDQMIEVKTHD